MLALVSAGVMGLAGCETTKIQEVEKLKLVQKLVPADIDLSEYPHVVEELAEHVEACGEGVVEAACVCDCPSCPDGVCQPGQCAPDCHCDCCKPKENRCSYTVKVDDLLLSHPLAKTGFVEDEKVFYSTGVFVEATPEEIAAVPDQWDLREFGRAAQVKINRQRCGDCWSQASTKGLELQLAVHDSKLVDLSVQTQISRCSNHGSCSGGYMSAPDFLLKYGNPFESQDPYQGKNTSCAFDMSKADFETKLRAAPYVGSSRTYSRFHRGTFSGAKVEQIKALMVKHKSNAVVTISAVSHSGGIIRRCSAINSGGNHMQNIIGWYQDGGDEIAKVWNSWGTSHGQSGVTHLKWECGDGKLNRGLGKAARVYVYEPDCVNQPDPFTGPDVSFVKATAQHGVIVGRPAGNAQQCFWAPSDGLTFVSADHCQAFASPDVTTEYHLTAETECGRASSMVLVTPLGPLRKPLSERDGGSMVRTPLGDVFLPTEQ